MSGNTTNPFSLAKTCSAPAKAQKSSAPKRKLKKGEDAFDRDIAHTLSIGQFTRQLAISYHRLEVAKDKLEAMLEDGQALPSLEVLNKEIDEGFAAIEQGKGLIESSQRLLKEWGDRKYAQKEKLRLRRTAIQETIGKLLPEAQGILAQIQARIERETNRLHLENIKLAEENQALKNAGNDSVSAEQITSRLKEFLEERLKQPVPVMDNRLVDSLREKHSITGVRDEGIGDVHGDSKDPF
ncbi:hypothetical protein BKA61DRAFT_594991 [Leptodontidium sp. MPI-SDFR-AT-0119]|nr:hypothetical protein BKA61DRAFT_594991 [Leptodontidium sp. MPI-SDFR-AT-0119]